MEKQIKDDISKYKIALNDIKHLATKQYENACYGLTTKESALNIETKLYNKVEILQELVNKELSINEDTASHSEKEILNMCVRLMQCVYGDMLDYMEFMGFDVPRNEDDEGYPMFNYSYSKIVQMLFLWRTTHSGGTSTRMKCDELGVDGSDGVEFKPELSEVE